VYFYEHAARTPERRRLERVRRVGFDGAPPDVGDLAAHARSGASMVGARAILVAFNVDLKTSDVTTAQKIARKIRESSGGFRHVKAMGLYLASRRRAQVSMNLTNFEETPLNEVLRAIEAEAPIADCELIGLVPRRAFEMFPDFFRRASNFDQSRIIEVRLLESR
jgi:glutamate formiminotransferase